MENTSTTVNTINSFGIDTATMLMEFNVSEWTARKLDKKESAEVVERAGAKDKGAARVNKSLMAGRTELDDIHKIASAARVYVYGNTSEWSPGQRWIPMARLLKVDKRMAEFKAEFESEVDSFCAVYPHLITAQAMALGDMFNRNEFPSVHEIRRKFNFSYDFFTVPNTNDFRVAIPAAAQADLRERMEKAMTQRVENAVGGMRKQLGEHLKRMSTRLVTVTDKDGAPKPTAFHDTLVSGAYELIDLIKELNVIGDHELTMACKRLEDVMGGCTTKTLKEDDVKRDDVKKEVDSILSTWSF